MASLAGCTGDTPPPLNEAKVRAFVTIRAEGIASMNAATLCSQYTDGAEIKGAFGDPSSTLTGKGYCERITEDFAKSTGGETLVSTRLSVKSFLIPLGGQSADLDQDQIELVDRSDGSQFKRLTLISSHLESVGGKPIITRESRTDSIVETRDPQPQAAPSATQASEPAPRDPENLRSTRTRADLPDDRPLASRASEVESQYVARDKKEAEDRLKAAERARTATLPANDPAEIMRRQCLQSREDLATLEREEMFGPPNPHRAGVIETTRNFVERQCK